MLEALDELLGAARTAGPLDERLALFERASAIAKDAAPYMRPRLAAMAVAQSDDSEGRRRIGRMRGEEIVQRLLAAERRRKPEPRLTVVDDGEALLEDDDDRSR